MKRGPATLLALTLLCSSILAQQTTIPAGRGLAERFKQYDKNGDGKVTRVEAAQMPMSDQWDADKDGTVTWQEADEARARARADAPKLEDAIGDVPPETLDLLGGKLHEVGWSEGKLPDASRKREIGYVIRYPKDREGPAAIVLLSHGGYGSSAGHYAFTDLATAYARLGFLAVNVGHRPSANEIQHRYDRPLDVSFVIDALVRTRAASLHIPGGGEGALPMPPEFKGIPDVDHIGHLGHSFGAFTAHAVGGADWSPTMGIRNFRDPRVDAIVPISPQGFHRFGGYDEGPDHNSWRGIRIPVYLICGEREGPEWRRQPFDRYPAIGDKYFTVAKGWGHNLINGDAATKRLLALNTALFFHTYLRGGQGRDRIGTLAWLGGWTLERRLESAGRLAIPETNSPPSRIP